MGAGAAIHTGELRCGCGVSGNSVWRRHRREVGDNRVDQLMREQRRVCAGRVAEHGDGEIVRWITREVGAIAGRRSRMADFVNAAVLCDGEAARV